MIKKVSQPFLPGAVVLQEKRVVKVTFVIENAALFVDQFNLPEYCTDLWVFFQIADLFFQSVRYKNVVGIQKSDIFPLRLPDRVIRRTGSALVNRKMK